MTTLSDRLRQPLAKFACDMPCPRYIDKANDERLEAAEVIDMLTEALDNVALPSQNRGYADWLKRFYDWWNGQAKDALTRAKENGE